MTVPRSRLVIATAVSATILGVPAAMTASAAANPKITGGHTSIVVDKVFAQSLVADGITLKPSGSADFKKGNLKLEITGGADNQPNYVVEYGGGFLFKDKAGKVKITNLVINTKKHTGTAKVSGAGTIDAFKIGDPNSGGPAPHGGIEFAGFTVSFTKAASKAIDQALDSSVFVDHKLLGVGKTTLEIG